MRPPSPHLERRVLQGLQPGLPLALHGGRHGVRQRRRSVYKRVVHMLAEAFTLMAAMVVGWLVARAMGTKTGQVWGRCRTTAL